MLLVLVLGADLSILLQGQVADPDAMRVTATTHGQADEADEVIDKVRRLTSSP